MAGTTLAEHRAGNRAHPSCGVGPHTCPAQGHARVLATVAIEKLLDALPDTELAVPAEELTWRPGFIQRALSSLPVRFPAIPEPVPGRGDEPPREETPSPEVVPSPLAPEPPRSGIVQCSGGAS